MNSFAVPVGAHLVGNHLPLTIIGGVNVLESYDLAARICEQFLSCTAKYRMPYIFKASFDKANRSSVHSFRGPGLDQGLTWLAKLKNEFEVPIVTDVHEPYQAQPAAEVVDLIQLPAFLARQTDLIQAIAKTGSPVQVKKPQYIAPDQTSYILEKFYAYGNQQVIICERGSCFGYNNLVVDMLGIDLMKREMKAPLVVDISHALQCRDHQSPVSGGRRDQIQGLARASTAMGIAGLFVEAHPDPEQAKCDGPCALPLLQLPHLLEQVYHLDQLVKKFV